MESSGIRAFLGVLKSDAASALAGAKTDSIGGPVIWGSLSVISTEYAIDDEGNERYIVTISEASPEAHELQKYVHDKLELAGYLHVSVVTEW